MIKLRTLDWVKNPDGSLCALPQGLRWNYYITPDDTGQFELALIDNNGDWSKELHKLYNDISEAQAAAKEHYSGVLHNLYTNEAI